MLWKCRILVNDNVILATGKPDGVQSFFRVNLSEVEPLGLDFGADDGDFGGSDDVAIVGCALLLFLFSAWLEALYVGADLFNGCTLGGVVGDEALLWWAIFGGCQGGFITRAEEVSEVRQHAESGMRQNNWGQNDKDAMVSTLRVESQSPAERGRHV